MVKLRYLILASAFAWGAFWTPVGVNAQAASGDQTVGGRAAPSSEFYVEGDGDNPWPELPARATVRKVRRAAGNTDPQSNASEPASGYEYEEPYPDSAPFDPIEDYELPLEFPAQSDVGPPPGMLVLSDQEPAIFNLASPQSSGGYSFNGNSVSISQVPWQAQIYFPRERMTLPQYKSAFSALLGHGVKPWAAEHYCGGALIAPGWVVTAAHCLKQTNVKDGFRVRLGQSDLINGTGQSYEILKIIHHAPYLPRTGTDIALIQIANNSRRHPAINLYNGVDPAVGRPITVYGWGRTAQQGESNAYPFLLKVDLQVMDRKSCEPFGKKYGWRIMPDLMCAESPPQTFRKTCRGDSGSPVVDSASRRLVAVVGGGGPRCTADRDPSFYIWIDAEKRGWIKRMTGVMPR
jgi:Trypsin